MNSALNSFNRIARYYDRLKRIVFGDSIFKSQIHFLGSVPPGCTVLILGGGSGEMLPALLDINPHCRIWFVEASSQMLRMAIDRLPEESANRVLFVHGTEASLPRDTLFEAVITNFFLDLFPDRRVDEVCYLISHRLGRNGMWLVSDFVSGKKVWQRILLWTMYRFFALTCGIAARRLPSWQFSLRREGMQEIAAQLFYDGFIKSVLYRKDSPSERA